MKQREFFSAAVCGLFIALTLAGCQPSKESLFTAVKRCDVSRVKSILAKKKDLVDSRNSGGETALMYASYFSCGEGADQLLSSGADVNAADRFGRTPLEYAAWNNPTADIIERLVKAGAALPAQDSFGNTALIMAAANEHGVPAASYLLKKGLWANQPNARMRNALMTACLHGHLDLVSLFLGNKADPDARDYTHATALMIVCEYQPQRIDIARKLIEKGADVKARTRSGNTALAACLRQVAQTGYSLDMLRLLLDRGAEINAQNSQGNTVLHTVLSTTFAMKANPLKESVVRILLDRGANLTLVNELGQTPLLEFVSTPDVWALMKKSRSSGAPIAELLVKKGSDLRARNKEGLTALMIAARGNRSDIVEVLTGRDKDINARDSRGQTALGIAKAAKAADAYRLLLSRGGVE